MAEPIEGLPEGLLQVVYGAGDVGETLVRTLRWIWSPSRGARRRDER